MKKKWKFFRGYPKKRIFTINVGDMNPNAVDEFMRRTAERLRREPPIDLNHVNLRYNQLNVNEDYYIPIRISKT